RYQSRVEMPPMPRGDPWPAIASVLQAESRAGYGEVFDAEAVGLAPYWTDLIRLTQVLFSQDDQRIQTLAGAMAFQRYRPYIMSRLGKRAALRRRSENGD